jgi:hypothetical protein
VGHKVTVRGKLSRESTPPTFTVRSVATISETCTSQSGTR